MKNKLPFCSTIILNYFGEKVIQKTVSSLLNLNYPKDLYEIIIVDNNSQDKSRKIIDRMVLKYKNIKKIYLDKNLGFAKGNNIGIKQTKGKFIALLNNDCFVDKNWLVELVRTIEKDKKIFAVTSKILLTDSINTSHKPKQRLIQNAGSIVFQDGYGRDIGTVIDYDHKQHYERDRGQYDKIREVYAVCCAACLFRKSVLEKIGYLDESFFFYYEDIELSERARSAGYELLFAPKATVYHLHAYSSGEWSPFFIYHAEKGRLLHVLYNFPSVVFIKEYIKFTAEAFARLLGISGLRSIARIIKLILHITLIIPALYKIFRLDKKFIKKFKVNFQYIKVSLYFLFLLPKLLVARWKKTARLDKQMIWKNYQSIVSGQWYFN